VLVLVDVEVHADDAIFVAERFGDGRADAAGDARDQDDLALFIHPSIPSSFRRVRELQDVCHGLFRARDGRFDHAL
jgi:hypothetical protein